MEQNIKIEERVLAGNLYHKDTVVLNYTIKYPHFVSEQCKIMLSKLNALYRTTAHMYQQNNVMNLYQRAMVDYETAKVNHYPFRRYESYADYTVTYNDNGIISMYFDRYEYTGGAHGSTIRSSDSWALKRGRRLRLSDIFPNDKSYREEVISLIIVDIEGNKNKGDMDYFEDYEDLVRENFKADQFYLTDEGIVIYFQQYDIAPYAYGLPTFLIPYQLEGMEPFCE